jgi:uncharacterized Zn finger protein (UPF0148 family)
MSSDDASDDSGFDKEAEREKLRKKYEADEQDRENTRRMSELLLQGATMTGKHCDNCGDPIFRYDGQEFCPTCQHEAEQAQAQEQAGAQEQPSDRGRTPEQGQTEPRGDARESPAATPADDQQTDAGDADRSVEASETVEQSGTEAEGTDQSDEPRVEIEGVRVADRHADQSNLRDPPSQAGSRGPQSGDRRRASERGHVPARDHGQGHEGAREREGGRERSGVRAPDDAADLATARESLVRKLTDLARRAEETDDVARARELLAATREAAEALDALDRANR